MGSQPPAVQPPALQAPTLQAPNLQPPAVQPQNLLPPPSYGQPPYQPPAYPPSGYQPEGYQSPGYPPSGRPPPGYPPSGYGYRLRPGPVDDLGRPMAEWWRRLLAYLLDAVILVVPWSILLAFTSNINSTSTTSNGSTVTTTFTSGTWVGIGIGFIVVLGYFAFLDGSRAGQTLGKKALDIAVRDISGGGPIGAGRALARRFIFFALYLAFVVPFFLNALWPLWDRRRQAWHDHAVNSCVIKVH